MKITQSDIDSLIDTVQFLKLYKNVVDSPELKENLDSLVCRTRKIYILLLHASANGQLDLRYIVSEGVADNSPVAEAVRSLCHLS